MRVDDVFLPTSAGPYHAELAYQDRYTIRTKITKVTGSLMDIRVAFLDVHEAGWRGLTVSKPLLKAPLVSALEATI